MLICDRCEKKASRTIAEIYGKTQGTNINLANKSIDLCDSCFDGLKKTVAVYLEPIPKSTQQAPKK